MQRYGGSGVAAFAAELGNKQIRSPIDSFWPSSE